MKYINTNIQSYKEFKKTIFVLFLAFTYLVISQYIYDKDIFKYAHNEITLSEKMFAEMDEYKDKDTMKLLNYINENRISTLSDIFLYSYIISGTLNDNLTKDQINEIITMFDNTEGHKLEEERLKQLNNYKIYLSPVNYLKYQDIKSTHELFKGKSLEYKKQAKTALLINSKLLDNSNNNDLLNNN